MSFSIEMRTNWNLRYERLFWKFRSRAQSEVGVSMVREHIFYCSWGSLLFIKYKVSVPSSATASIYTVRCSYLDGTTQRTVIASS